jgi:hypothetical protein
MASLVKQESGGVNVVVRGPINKELEADTDEDGVAEPCAKAGALSHKVTRISELGRRSIITKQYLHLRELALIQSAGNEKRPGEVPKLRP